MNFFVFLLSICIGISYANAQYQPHYYGGLYPNYPNYPIIDGRTPNSGENIGDNRLFWSYLTSTTSTTTTTTTTCTISTTKCTSGRRKRFLEDIEEEIAPSPVNQVETTPVTELDSVRKERKADPQFAFWRGGFDQPPYELRSTFGEVGQRIPFQSYNPFMRRPIMAADPRFLLYYLTTTTKTSTVTSTTTSTPVCSQASGYNQC